MSDNLVESYTKLNKKHQETLKENKILKEALKQVIKNMYHLDREYFIGTPPTEEEYCKNNFKYWLEQAKENMK